jgi:hypothetical protein
MREIKFRAWDGNKMLPVTALYPMMRPNTGIACRVADGTADQIIFAEAILQYTGRTDLTPSWEDTPRPGSVELYEGDIVDAWVSRYPNDKIRGWIIYNDAAQAFQLRYLGAFGNAPSDFLHKWHFFKRLGNIYENKNLLEK